MFSEQSQMDPKKRDKFKKAVKHRTSVGYGKMNVNTRFDSIETNDFGVRIVIKTCENIDRFVVPVTSDVVKVKPKPKTSKSRKKIGKKKAAIVEMNADEALDPELRDAIGVGVDEGRAKLFTSSMRSKTETGKYLTVKFMRFAHTAKPYSLVGSTIPRQSSRSGETGRTVER